MTKPTGRPKGRPPGTGKPRRLTVRVVFLVEPVVAARIERERQDGETMSTAARRILVDALDAMASREEG